jgi:hypothetical protein
MKLPNATNSVLKARSRFRVTTSTFRTLTYSGIAILALVFSTAVVAKSVAKAASGQQKAAASKPALRLALLEVKKFGTITEIKARTSSDAAVMINGNRVPMVLEDGSFTYYLETNNNPDVTITAQDARGGSMTLATSID